MAGKRSCIVLKQLYSSYFNAYFIQNRSLQLSVDANVLVYPLITTKQHMLNVLIVFKCVYMYAL